MSVKPNQGQLDHRIASAEGTAQAEIRRRERAERKLDRTLEDLELIQFAAVNMLQELDDSPVDPFMTVVLAPARRDLIEATLTAQRRLRRYNHTPTPTNGTPALAADATRSTPA